MVATVRSSHIDWDQEERKPGPRGLSRPSHSQKGSPWPGMPPFTIAYRHWDTRNETDGT